MWTSPTSFPATSLVFDPATLLPNRRIVLSMRSWQALRNAHCARRSSLTSPRRSTKCDTSACCINWRPPSQAHTICSCNRTLPTGTSRSGIMLCALTATRWGPVSPRAVFLAPCSTYFSPPIYPRRTTPPSRLLRMTWGSWRCIVILPSHPSASTAT